MLLLWRIVLNKIILIFFLGYLISYYIFAYIHGVYMEYSVVLFIAFWLLYSFTYSKGYFTGEKNGHLLLKNLALQLRFHGESHLYANCYFHIFAF